MGWMTGFEPACGPNDNPLTAQHLWSQAVADQHLRVTRALLSSPRQTSQIRPGHGDILETRPERNKVKGTRTWITSPAPYDRLFIRARVSGHGGDACAAIDATTLGATGLRRK
jgi:hypothetical protein